jgi:hypothetical protein
MKNNIFTSKYETTPVRLRLELKDENLSDYQKRMLKRYGESISGDSIVRDILIPSDMPLHNLHYAIQKLFGWQNSHLRRFYLPEEIYSKLTGDTVKGWADLVGTLFQPPSEGEEDLFWDDDYDSGSFKVWLKKKYTGPYNFAGEMEYPEVAKEDVQELLDRFKMVEVREPFWDYMERVKRDKNTEMKIIKKAALVNLTIAEMNASIVLETGTENLLERLEVNKVLAAQGEKLDSNSLFPTTKELFYNYDFGDNWIVKITKYKDCEDLLEQNSVDDYELTVAKDIVLDKHKPVCIYKEGISLLDDVGGLSGFADMLGTIYEGEDKEEASSYRIWAKSLGWSDKKVSNRGMI